MPTPSFERIAAVTARTGVPRSSLYRLIKQGRFPSPIKLSERSSAWRSSDVDAWIAARSNGTPA
ncbi:helix-turn-helix transcriptional regulator [Aeromonas caviae]|uniref:helix-turn-helix transcriptional regulator n=1 Tax=Aeromonas caviae TaxID=648 RepID=UPI003F74912F